MNWNNNNNNNKANASKKKPEFKKVERNHIPMDYLEMRNHTGTDYNKAVADYLTNQAFEICREVHNNFRSSGRDAPGFLFEVFGYIQQAIANTPFVCLKLKTSPELGLGQDEDALMEPIEYVSTLNTPYDVTIYWPIWLRKLVIWAVDPSMTDAGPPYSDAQSKLRYAMLKKFEALFFEKVTSKMMVHYRFDGFLSWPKFFKE